MKIYRNQKGSMSLMAVAVALPIALLLAAAVLDLSRNLIAQSRMQDVLAQAVENVALAELPPAKNLSEITPTGTAPQTPSAVSPYSVAAAKYCVAAQEVFNKQFQGILSPALKPANHGFQFSIVRIDSASTQIDELGSSDKDLTRNCSKDQLTALKGASLNLDATELGDVLMKKLQAASMTEIGVLGYATPASGSTMAAPVLATYWVVGVGYAKLDNVLLGVFFPGAGVVGQKIWTAYPLIAGIEN